MDVRKGYDLTISSNYNGNRIVIRRIVRTILQARPHVKREIRIHSGPRRVTCNISRSLAREGGRGVYRLGGIEKSKYRRGNVQITNRVQRRSLSGSITPPIEDSQDTTSEFQSTVFCFPNQRSEKPFGLLQIRRTSR